jgi:hypothetical protein
MDKNASVMWEAGARHVLRLRMETAPGYGKQAVYAMNTKSV